MILLKDKEAKVRHIVNFQPFKASQEEAHCLLHMLLWLSTIINRLFLLNIDSILDK